MSRRDPSLPPRYSASDEIQESNDEGTHGARLGVHIWFEALVFAFVLAMFVRTYMFELFKVPTESMIPTIIGGKVAEIDWDRDGSDDLVVPLSGNAVSVFRWEKDRYVDIGPQFVPQPRLDEWVAAGRFQQDMHRILVNKFAYWFRNPRRGEIVVFKVPPAIWDPAKPVYIKRAVGLPGESLRTRSDGKLARADSEVIQVPDLFRTQAYTFNVETTEPAFRRFPYVDYGKASGSSLEILGVNVPEEMVYVLGDNTRSSLDSRYWGGVDLDRLRGRAFFRYWPLSKLSFLE